MATNVQVVCRYRPPVKRNDPEANKSCVEFDSDHKNIIYSSKNDKNKKYPFTFDYVFTPTDSQSYVYDKTADKFVDEILKGFNCTIFAYGQTGSGKTHTMMGVMDNEEDAGIIPRLVQDIFLAILEASLDIEFTIKVSYVEIYNEKIRDLLCPSKVDLKIREGTHGVYIQDVKECYVANAEQVFDIMATGTANRAIASTMMNVESSRSHSVFILTIGQTLKMTGAKKFSKCILVDLAGSEQVKKTGAAGPILAEAQFINKSLSFLGLVITNLTEGNPHIPYRDSKLTRILSESLGGNSKTCLIITVCPSAFNAEETLCSLRFGKRAKSIKNKPKVNQERSVDEYKRLLDDAERKIHSQAKYIITLEADVLDYRKQLGLSINDFKSHNIINNNNKKDNKEKNNTYDKRKLLLLKSHNKSQQEKKKNVRELEKEEQKAKFFLPQVSQKDIINKKIFGIETDNNYDDENEDLSMNLRRKNTDMKWDRKRKKFIFGQNNNDDGLGGNFNTKRRKTESGKVIKGTYKTGIYEKWVKQSKQSIPLIGSCEDDLQFQKKFQKKEITNRNKTKTRRNEKTKNELKTDEVIRKERIVMQKKKELMNRRTKKNKTKRSNNHAKFKSKNKK